MNLGYEVDFLPVGDEQSGDAITLRFGNVFGERDEQFVVVIDGGFADTGKQVIEHLRKHYKTDRVDLVISTHPDADHAAGLERVLNECQVGCLWMHQPWNHTDDIAKMFKDGRVTDKSVTRLFENHSMKQEHWKGSHNPERSRSWNPLQGFMTRAGQSWS